MDMEIIGSVCGDNVVVEPRCGEAQALSLGTLVGAASRDASSLVASIEPAGGCVDHAASRPVEPPRICLVRRNLPSIRASCSSGRQRSRDLDATMLQ
jgi:hypothetical protein